VVSISNTDRALLQFIRDSVGAGCVSSKRIYKANHSPSALGARPVSLGHSSEWQVLTGSCQEQGRLRAGIPWPGSGFSQRRAADKKLNAYFLMGTPEMLRFMATSGCGDVVDGDSSIAGGRGKRHRRGADAPIGLEEVKTPARAGVFVGGPEISRTSVHDSSKDGCCR
jgi:hypothetical protein